ncbi:MAG: hypothetical protein JO188_19015 [Hyphomicrobiales bacterium]|nr:hypothetical protein [Hyphomicrobiales bacterium]
MLTVLSHSQDAQARDAQASSASDIIFRQICVIEDAKLEFCQAKGFLTDEDFAGSGVVRVFVRALKA